MHFGQRSMVLKKSKYGYNSGRTLRRYDKDYHSNKDRFATISIKNNRKEIEFKNDFEQNTASLLEQLEPNVEYSLNKRRRWSIVEKAKEEKYFHDVSMTCLEQVLPDKRSLSFHISGNKVIETSQNQFHKFAKVDKSRLDKRNNCHYKKYKKSFVGKSFSSKLISSGTNKSFDGASLENNHYLSKCLLCKQFLCLFCDSVNECEGSPPQPNVNTVEIEIKREIHIFKSVKNPFFGKFIFILNVTSFITYMIFTNHTNPILFLILIYFLSYLIFLYSVKYNVYLKILRLRQNAITQV